MTPLQSRRVVVVGGDEGEAVAVGEVDRERVRAKFSGDSMSITAGPIVRAPESSGHHVGRGVVQETVDGPDRDTEGAAATRPSDERHRWRRGSMR